MPRSRPTGIWNANNRAAGNGRRARSTFPLCGNGLCKPPDSGFRRAATGLLPSRHIQDCLSINDGEVDSGLCWNDGGVPTASSSFQRKLACMDAGGRAASGTGGRGIQEGSAGVVNEPRPAPDWHDAFIVIPAQAGMYCIHHWIPAFAGMTRGILVLAGRLRASCPLAAYRTSCP